MTIQYPKREQRKQASRAALVQAAIELFGKRGLEDTKLEDVAERAGLHVQTLYRHFSNKRELVTAVDQHYLARFQEACAKRTRDTLHFWRGWTGRSARNIMSNSTRYKKAIHNLYALPEFPTPYLRIWHEYENTLAESVAQDMRVNPSDDPLPVLIACMLWGGTNHVFRTWLADGGSADLEAQTLAIVDAVIDQYGHLLTDVQASRG